MVFAWSGGAEVVAHGAVTTFFGGQLHVSVPVEPPLRVEFWFRSDPEVDGVSARAEWNEIGVLLDCVNFDDDSGRGTRQPMYLQDDGEYALFLHFRVFRHGRSDDRTVQFSFYRARRDQLPPGALDWEPA